MKKYRESIDEIELRLKPIEEFVQTARDDLAGIRGESRFKQGANDLPAPAEPLSPPGP